MSEWISVKDRLPEVVRLGTRIAHAQTNEVLTMTTYLATASMQNRKDVRTSSGRAEDDASLIVVGANNFDSDTFCFPPSNDDPVPSYVTIMDFDRHVIHFSTLQIKNTPSAVLPPNKHSGRNPVLKMEITPEVLATLFDFRVLLRYDAKYKVHVAHCVQTGSIVTSDSQEEALEMMKELLEDEISFALRNKNLKNLFSSPAPLEVHLQWVQAEKLKPVFLDVDFGQLEYSTIEPKNAHLRNKVEFALAV